MFGVDDIINTEVRLVAIDLDGTLLDDNKKIAPTTIAAIKEVMQRGIHVTLASSRPHCAVVPYAKQLLINVPLVAHGGAYIADSDEKEILLRQTLDSVQVWNIIRILEEHQYYIKVYCDNILYVQEAIKETLEYSRTFNVPFVEVGHKRLTSISDVPIRIALYDTSQRIAAARSLLKQWHTSITLSQDTENGLEIIAGEVSKATALKVICRKFNISMDNVMAIGNEGNDVEMIREAGYGIAMGNACSDLRKYASYITKSNNELGVEHVLNQYILQR